MEEFQAIVAILCSEDVLGSLKLLLIGSHLFWPQIRLVLYLKEIFVIESFSDEKMYIQLYVIPVPHTRICCTVTKLSTTIAFHCLLILLSTGNHH